MSAVEVKPKAIYIDSVPNGFIVWEYAGGHGLNNPIAVFNTPEQLAEWVRLNMKPTGGG